MTKPRLEWLLLFIPVSLALSFRQQELAVFFTSALAILPLAALIGRSTEQLAIRAGPRAGGLLNATFGNITELIISILLILRNETQIVKASLTGSILGNLLLVLGMSLFVGGLRDDRQRFSSQTASVHTSSMILAVAGFLMPALFVLSSGRDTLLQREVVSGVVLAVIAVTLAAMARPVFARWFGADFVGSTVALYWLLPGLWCLGMNTLLYQHLSSFGMPVFMVVSTCAGAVFNAVVNLWAIPRYGMAGAAAVSSATYILLLVSTMVYLNTSRRTELTA